MEWKTKKKLFLIAGKILVSAILLAVIFKKAGLQNILSHLQSMDLRYFFISSALYIVIVSIAALRWSLLLEDRFPLSKLISLYFIGSFFNHILPGSVGGDTVKIYYLYKDTRKGGSSIGSVFLDRYIGLFALLMIGLVSGLAAFQELKTIRMQWAIPTIVAFFLAGSLIVFGLKAGRKFEWLADFYDYFGRSLKKKRTILKAFLLSLAVQALNIGTIYLVALGLGQKLPFTALFIFAPIIVTVTTIPISLSGFGVREGAFVLLFGIIGIPPQVSVSISVLWFLSAAAPSLIGLEEFLRFNRKALSPRTE